MQIGDILHNARTQKSNPSVKKLGLVELSAQCGVSYGQIARIEKNLSQPRILTLVRISDALGLTLKQIVQELELNHLLKRQWIAPREYQVPLNMSRSKFISWLQTENKKGLEEATNLLAFSSPFDMYRSKADHSPYQVIELITMEFARGGLITLEDLSCYLLSVRKQQNISQWELGKLVEIEYRAIQRLENADLQFIDWDLLLKIDQSLELNGAMIGLAWAVAEFESGIFLKDLFKKYIPDLWSEENKLRLTNLITQSRLKGLATRPYIDVDSKNLRSPKRIPAEIEPDH